jgi:hypothetical protein
MDKIFAYLEYSRKEISELKDSRKNEKKGR